MVFSSMVFLCVFLPAAFCLHLLLPGMRAKNFLLVVASLVFYAYGEPIYVILLVASSAGNYILARLTGECPKIRKLTMTLAVVINLGLLVIFKYSGFLVETFNSVTGAGIPVPQVRMPIGISFFTFQALSYVIDVYRGDASVQKNFGKVLLYISFFPQLIAGPIVKYHDVEAEINNRKQTPEEIGKGIRRHIQDSHNVCMICCIKILSTYDHIIISIFFSSSFQLHFFSAMQERHILERLSLS